MLSKSRRILEKITRDWDIQKHTTTAHNTEALSIAIQQKPKQQKKSFPKQIQAELRKFAPANG